MIWQDLVVGLCSIILGYAIVPEVYSNYKNKKPSVTYQTSFITFVGLYVLSFTFFSMNLYFGAFVDFLTATLWLALFIQRIVYN